MGPLHVSTTETTPEVKKISGQKLAKWRRMGLIPPVFAARLADALQTGTVTVSNFTPSQSVALTGAKPADIAAARRERRKHRPTVVGNGSNGKHQDRLFYRNRPTDADLDVAVAQHGPRLMAALDRATSVTR